MFLFESRNNSGVLRWWLYEVSDEEDELNWGIVLISFGLMLVKGRRCRFVVR